MTDIVERLRQERPQFYESLLKEAADEIERLRADEASALQVASVLREEVIRSDAEVERLRLALRNATELAEKIDEARCAEIERLRGLLKD